ncbi:hypothetical protein MWU78_09125 [Arenibacter sp. F26102]|uniref:hypothetical protein n=1 Tax=Arenibacter sp. F26102 TaxID=2926416 RepID=UPI001FF1302B|nr:hypothetical protein [Arenibacter sp. F26102]MCK0145803.1 hypothetical protein [Arenibacter sp. F26102]
MFQFIILVTLFVQVTVEAQVKDICLPIIIDADTANEVDDLYAIVLAIVESKFNILGIILAQFHTSPLATDSTANESQRINERIL